MKKIALFIGVTFISLYSFSQDCEINFNGIYVSTDDHNEDEIKKYLRFYEDGEVISVASYNPETDVIKWFNKKTDDIAHGEYTQAACDIEFTTRNSQGKIYFKGTIDEYNHLSLKVLYPGMKKKNAKLIEYEFHPAK